MGPPINIWPCAHPGPILNPSEQLDNSSDTKVYNRYCYEQRKCTMFFYLNRIRLLCLNITVALIFFQFLLSLHSVKAGPVVMNMSYYQGSVALARNIRHLPCVSRRTAEEGLCMFAIDCLKSNGTHLGTCIDRFYFGSCCQLPDKNILPEEIISNNIEENAIDGASFVHPQTTNKNEYNNNKIPNKLTTIPLSTTTEKVEIKTEKNKIDTTLSVQDKTDSLDLDMKLEENATVDNKINNEVNKLTSPVLVETTTKSNPTKETSNHPEITSEYPMKLSTYQSVSSDVHNIVTEKIKIETTEALKHTTPSSISVTTDKFVTKPYITRKPITYRPRPTLRPSNFTRPQFTATTLKPRPTIPINIYNNTRKPPYRPPPKRPTTKKPLPSPPRLNITIIPQSTSSRPVFTRPLISTSTITYINHTPTPSSVEDKIITTTVSTTTPTATSTTTSSTTPKPTTTTTTEKAIVTTETILDTSPLPTTVELTTEKSYEKLTTYQVTESVTETETTEQTIPTSVVTENETIKPMTEENIPLTSSSSPIVVLTTDFPPLSTWSSNTVELSTKPTEKVENATQTVDDEVWSPITPPEGWVLVSTIPPKPESSTAFTSSSTSTTTTTTTTTPEPTTIQETIQTESTEKVIELSSSSTTTESFTTTTTTTTKSPVVENEMTSSSTESLSSTSSKPLTTQQQTDAPIMEFTVNVTLTPMPSVDTSTSSIGLSTFTSVVSSNVTEPSATSEASNDTTKAPLVESSTSTSSNASAASAEITTTENPLNMSNYREVCGLRLWPEARIVGGAQSAFGRWPWQISLRQYRTSTYLHKCGAALLNENWAITAAHCVEHVPPSELLVRLGEHDLASDDEPYKFAERRVQIVASHPHFDPATFEYDLALLRFYEPVTFQPNILPVCVPDNDENFVGKTAHVTGWGRLYDEGPLPSVLQEVSVPVINNSACEAMYQAAGYNEHIPNIFICAGWKRGGSDSCEGDSGGPMVIQRDRDKRFVLSGVISWGIGCAEPNQPGVYTRISEFRDWINQILQF